MKSRYSLQILICFLFISTVSFAQNCGCTLTEVETNTVVPCSITIGTVVNVSTTTELKNAINLANSSGGNMTILIADGTYPIASTSWYPYITASNVVFRSLSGNRDAVILTGQGMNSVDPQVENCFYIVGDNVTISDLTIKEVGNHGIATEGDSLFVHNVKIQNTYEQMVKGTSAGDGSDYSSVQCSLFEYTNGVGPQYYIGGLDIHEGSNWTVNDNIFKSIASPSATQAEHAVHFWDYSSDNTVERNLIFNCDRGIGFGLGSSPNSGGIIRNNMIYNDGTGSFADVGIGLETSPNTKVYNNTIFIEYPNAIEYRFSATTNVDITNNLTNKIIKMRDGGQATLTTNYTDAMSSWFVNTTTGNLRLNNNIPLIVDQGTSLVEVSMDIDQSPRPQGSGFDMGAHEFLQPLSIDQLEVNSSNFTIYPNPAIHSFSISSKAPSITSVSVFDVLGKVVAKKAIEKPTSFADVSTQGWKSGIYTCRILTEEYEIHVLKIVVSK